MFFTQEDYRKIQDWLSRNSSKDSELLKATPLNGNEIISIVQANHNKKISIKDFVNQIFKVGSPDFFNVTDKLEAPYITLEEAINMLPTKAKKQGQVITFLNKDGNWDVYQFIGANNQCNIPDKWNNIFDIDKYIIDSLLPDEEDLTKTEPDEKGNSFLSFKDRLYDASTFSGLGKKVLRKHIIDIEVPEIGTVKKNILYQDIFEDPNTVYEIRYDFDLNGKTIELPENCILDFRGGSITNGTLVLNNTLVLPFGYIENDILKCNIEGTYKEGQMFFNREDGYFLMWDGNEWISAATYFRWGPNNTIQISRNNRDWEDLSEPFSNSLYIKGYVNSTSNLPSNALLGDIYMVGTGAPYNMYVKTSEGWKNNGQYTSITAGIEQTTGQSTTNVMSQKAVTDKLTELESELDDMSLGSKSILGDGYIFSKENLMQGTPTYIEDITVSTKDAISALPSCKYYLNNIAGFLVAVYEYDSDGKGAYTTWMAAINEFTTKDNTVSFKLAFRTSESDIITPNDIDAAKIYIQRQDANNKLREHLDVNDLSLSEQQSSIININTRGGVINEDLFEVGNVYITTSGWNYTSSASRIRIKKGFSIPLYKGDIISLADYSNARFFVGWRDSEGNYFVGENGWYTSDYVVTNNGDYIILLSNIIESPISAITDLVELVKIKTASQIEQLVHKASFIPELLKSEDNVGIKTISIEVSEGVVVPASSNMVEFAIRGGETFAIKINGADYVTRATLYGNTADGSFIIKSGLPIEEIEFITMPKDKYCDSLSIAFNSASYVIGTGVVECEYRKNLAYEVAVNSNSLHNRILHQSSFIPSVGRNDIAERFSLYPQKRYILKASISKNHINNVYVILRDKNENELQSITIRENELYGVAEYYSEQLSSNAYINIYTSDGDAVGELHISLEEIRDDADIVRLNDISKIDSMLRNMSRKPRIGAAVQSIEPFVFIHFSDLHGDEANLKRVIQIKDTFAQYIKEVLFTGDMVYDNFDDGTFETWVSTQGTNVIKFCIGNHEVKSTNDISASQVYEKYFKPYNDKWLSDVIQPSNQADCETNGYMFWLKDYDICKVRLIALDCMYISERQKSFLSDALNEVLDKSKSSYGYHVMIINHWVDGGMTGYENSFNSKQKVDSAMAVFEDYVSLVDNYMQKGGSFVGWFGGHTHLDRMGFIGNDARKQNIIAVDTATIQDAMIKASDTDRKLHHKSQDLFNVVSINTFDRIINIFRIGADINSFLQKKDITCISY